MKDATRWILQRTTDNLFLSALARDEWTCWTDEFELAKEFRSKRTAERVASLYIEHKCKLICVS